MNEQNLSEKKSDSGPEKNIGGPCRRQKQVHLRVRHSETSLLAGGILLFFFFLRLCSVPSLLRCGCDSLSHVYVQEVGYFGNPRHEEAQSRVSLRRTY